MKVKKNMKERILSSKLFIENLLKLKDLSFQIVQVHKSA